MLGNFELNVDTTNNQLALTSYFANPSFNKTVLLAYERVLHAGNTTRIGIMIGEGFAPKIHCHFRLSFHFCELIYGGVAM